MRELGGRVTDALPHHGAVDGGLVDVQQQQDIDIGIETLAHSGPLLGAAAMDEPLVGQLDPARRAGVHTLLERLSPTCRFGEVVDHLP